MSELFSNDRVIDYFTIFGLDINKLVIDNFDYGMLSNLSSDESDYMPIRIEYRHKIFKMYPKKLYKGKSIYELNLESIFHMLTTEYVYLKKPPNKFFSLMFTNMDGKHYYGFFLKVYEELDQDHPIHQELKENNNANSQIKVSIFSPKYLTFISYNPYFISFNHILYEIYIQSTLNDTKCYKVENIISTLLYRMYLPKYETTQLSWTLNDKIYTFSRNRLENEISFKLLFSYISIDKVVLLYVAFLLNSIVIFFHTNLDIVAPIIYLFLQLLHPFTANYNIITNLNPTLKELLECPTANIVIGIHTVDYDNLGEIISLINRSNANIVYCDIDNNKLIVDNNEDMKNIELLPRQRINNLIDSLCKYAEIYEKERNRFEEMKKLDIWEFFQSRNNFDLNRNINFQKKKRNLRETLTSKKTLFNINQKDLNINKFDKFSDDHIRSLFLEFNLGLIEAYDEIRHYEINEETQDVTFLPDKFIEESKPDIKKFLQLIIELPIFDIFMQNMQHIVDQRHKNDLKKNNPKYYKTEFKMNPVLREAALISDFEKTYNLIMTGFERMKNGKSLNKLFKTNIYHTISIPSPKYEKLPYRQNNIFLDPIHDEIIPHTESIQLNKLKIDYNFINLDLKDQLEFNQNLLRDEMMYLFKKEEANNRKLDNKSESKNEIINLLRSITLEMNAKNPLTVDFKNYLLSNGEMVKMFYGFMLTKLKNLITKNIEGKSPIKTMGERAFSSAIKHNLTTVLNTATNNTVLNTVTTMTNQNNQQNNFLQGLNQFKSDALNQLSDKQEYINNFNNYYDTYIKERTNPMIEFHISFGVNVIQSVAFCEYCKKPNTLWDIRKEFLYYKSKRESRTKCKFCSQLFVPYFYVLEESSEPEPTNKKKGKKNKSFEVNVDTNPNLNTEMQGDLLSNKNHLDNTKKSRRVEYMSFDHILNTFYDYENEEKEKTNLRNKKFPYDLFYNICMLLCEVKVRIEKKINIEVFTFEGYIKKQFNKNNEVAENHKNSPGSGPNQNSKNNFFQDLISNQISKNSNNNVVKFFRDTYLKKKKEIEEQNLEKEKKVFKGRLKVAKYSQYAKFANKVTRTEDKVSIKEKMVNIKFDIKDLMNDKKYSQFENDLHLIPQFNKKNVTNVMRETLANQITAGQPIDNKIFQSATGRASKDITNVKHDKSSNPDKMTSPLRFSKTENRRSLSRSVSKSHRVGVDTKFTIDLVRKSTYRTPSRSRTKSRKKSRKNKQSFKNSSSQNNMKIIKKDKIQPDNNFFLTTDPDFDDKRLDTEEELRRNLGYSQMGFENKISFNHNPNYVNLIPNNLQEINPKYYSTTEQMSKNNSSSQNKFPKVKKFSTGDNDFLKKYDELAKNTFNHKK